MKRKQNDREPNEGKSKKSRKSKDESDDEKNVLRGMLLSGVVAAPSLRPFAYVKLNQALPQFRRERTKAHTEYWSKELVSQVIGSDRDPDYNYETALKEHLEKIGEAFPNGSCKVMRETVSMLVGSLINVEFCCPRKCGVQMEDDFEDFGRMECVENFVCAYREEWIKPEDKRDLKKLWTPVTALAHWLKIVGASRFRDEMDRIRWNSLIRLVGSMVLSMFDRLEKANELNNTSAFEDLGLTVGLYLSVCQDNGSGVESYCPQNGRWFCDVVEYIRDFELEVPDVYGVRTAIHQTWEDKHYHRPNMSKKDRWRFARDFVDHRDAYGPAVGLIRRESPKFLGGRNYDLRFIHPESLKGYLMAVI